MDSPALWALLTSLEEIDDPNSQSPSLPQALLRYIPFVDQCEAGYEGLGTHEETIATVIFERFWYLKVA